MTYAQRRTAAIALAAACGTWGRPPVPERTAEPDRIVPSFLAVRTSKAGVTQHGWMRVKNCFELDHYYGAKERRQNRVQFQ